MRGFVRAMIVAGAMTLTGCAAGGPGPNRPPPTSDLTSLTFGPELEIDLADFEKTASGLYVQDVQVGDGPVARRTSRVWVHYVGWLSDGTLFDGNLGGEPYHARLGGNEVIRGWNEGIVGMRRGGIRRLVVPPELAYGSRAVGVIPPGSTLVFYLELADVD